MPKSKTQKPAAGPTVGGKPRARNKDGRWRKKRKDAKKGRS